PLRDRPEDVAALAQAFAKRYAADNKIDPPPLTAELFAMLQAHDWPGNVRELENYVERLVLLSRGGALDPKTLPPPGRAVRLRKTAKSSGDDVAALIERLVEVGIDRLPPGELKAGLVDAVERAMIEQVMRRCHNVGVKAAKMIGINRNTLHTKLDDYKRADEQAEPGV